MAEGTKRDYELHLDPSWREHRLKHGDFGPAKPSEDVDAPDEKATQEARKPSLVVGVKRDKVEALAEEAGQGAASAPAGTA